MSASAYGGGPAAPSAAAGKPQGGPPDIGPKKTMVVVVIVVGCFAVLWPKVFHPMFFGSPEDYMKPSAIDKSTGCCDVLSESDVNTIKIMGELCQSVVAKAESEGLRPPTGRELVRQCRTAVLDKCGIDISAVLEEQVRLGHTVKKILNEVRSLNGSLCLKHNFGVAPWSLGVPHRIVEDKRPTSVRQERPPHMRAEMMHPAFRERGSAIPRTTQPSKGPPKIIEGRPGPIPGMRPPMGGAGHVVPPSQKGSSMGIIMPIYTIGIVIFFTYTLMKLLFKKQPDGAGGSLYPPVESDRSFRRDVFEAQPAPRLSRDVSSKIVVNAMSALLDEVDEELEARRKAAAEVASQNGSVANGHAKTVKVEPEKEKPKVAVMGMETVASCEGGKKWSNAPEVAPFPVRPVTPVTLEIKDPPQEIYLEGALPHHSSILVTDAKTETNRTSESEDDPAIVLAGKMTLSVISLDTLDDSQTEDHAVAEDEDEEATQADVNGTEELLTESKYTTASGTTAAEPDVSDDVGTPIGSQISQEEGQEDLIEDVELNHVSEE